MLKETADQKANALASVGVLILILMEHAQRADRAALSDSIKDDES